MICEYLLSASCFFKFFAKLCFLCGLFLYIGGVYFESLSLFVRICDEVSLGVCVLLICDGCFVDFIAICICDLWKLLL